MCIFPMKNLFKIFFIFLFTLNLQAQDDFSWGGGFNSDLLIFDNLPTEFSRKNSQALPDFHISRNITNLWGEYQLGEGLAVRVGVLNSFREYFDEDTPENDFSFPSEFLINTAYVDIDKLANGKLKMRLGRQHIKYGRGRVVFEPNPLDAVRTSFFDALKATWVLANNEIDFIAFKNNDFNSLVLNEEPRRLAQDDIHGAIIYAKNKELKKFPFEYYYLFTSENFDERRESNTLGARLMPQFTKSLRAEVELATQIGKVGRNKQTGMLFFGSLSYEMKIANFKPELTAGYYFLSGDDPDTKKNEAWNGALAGWAQFSNLMVISNIGGEQGFSRFNNLKSPFVELAFPVFEGRLKFSYWKLMADDAGNVNSLGSDRGDLFMIKLDYPITEKLQVEVISEWLQVGNYYPGDMKDANFFRLRLKYSF